MSTFDLKHEAINPELLGLNLSALKELSNDIFEEDLIETECAYCNCTLHDCSLCGVSSFDCAENGESIC